MKSVVLAVAAMMVVFPRAGAADLAPSPEAHARAEFQKYATRIVGKPATVDAEGVFAVEGTAAVFAIGRCRSAHGMAEMGAHTEFSVSCQHFRCLAETLFVAVQHCPGQAAVGRLALIDLVVGDELLTGLT